MSDDSQLSLAVLEAPQAPSALAPATPPSPASPALLYLARLSPGSRRTMRGALETIAHFMSAGTMDAETLPWGKLRYEHALAIRTYLASGHAPATVNKMLCALRAVLKEAWQLRQISGDDYQHATSVENVPGSRLPAGRDLSAGELRALFSACDPNHPKGARDAALLAVLYQGGLRRSEAISLDLGDYSAETGDLVVRHGKGGKERMVYLSGGGHEAMAAWLAFRGLTPGPLFCQVKKGGKLTSDRISDHSVRDVAVALARRAGLPKLSPHDFRRTFIGDLLDSSDVSTAQQLAGHASAATTTRYDRRPAATRRKAAESLYVPFRR